MLVDAHCLILSDQYVVVPAVVCFSQDYGLDVEAFSELVPGCPPRVLELSASCCQVSVKCECDGTLLGKHGEKGEMHFFVSF